MNRRFWKGRRVFLTGHTGFKGSWFSFWLLRAGARVTGYALRPAKPSLFVALRLEKRMKSIEGDLRDLLKLRQNIRAARPEIVIHMAAQALVRRSYRDPLDTFSTNVMGTAHLLEACRAVRGLRAVLVVTSDKCYEENRLRVFRENDPLGGNDPYSASKACAEIVTQSYARNLFGGERHGCGIATARAGNVIGGGDWAEDRLIPDCIRAFARRTPVTIRNPEALRPWQHVLDPLEGYALLAERLFFDSKRYEGAWNFGPSGRPVATRFLVRKSCEFWGHGATWVFSSQPDPLKENKALRLDSRKARARLGWKPVWSVERALRRTLEWYRGFLSGEEPSALCNQQIDEYESRPQ